MNKWFDLDSPLMQGLSRMADLVILSILWFVCCIPVITIGASTTAMYYVALKIAREDNEEKLTTSFFKAFKSNFKQATIMNIISLVIGVILLLDCWIMLGAEGSMVTFSSAAFFALFVWLLCIMFYAYPMQAQFYNTVKQTLINAAQLSMRKFLTTIVVFVLNTMPILVTLISLNLSVRMAPIWILLWPGLATYINAKLFVKIFDPFLKVAEEEAETAEV